MVNEAKFRSMLPLLNTNREVACLSHAIWLHGATVRDKSPQMIEYCYQNARHHLEKTEIEEQVGIYPLQSIILIALYEFKQMCFARAWMSIGRAIRLAQMLGLHKMDCNTSIMHDSGYLHGLHPTNDWEELEERRRTFWVAFNVDWYASSRTASPMNISDKEVSRHGSANPRHSIAK